MSSFKGNGRGKSGTPLVPLQMSFRPMSAAELVRSHPGSAQHYFRSTPEERREKWVTSRKGLFVPQKAPSKVDLMSIASGADNSDMSLEETLASMSTAGSLRKVLLEGSLKPAAPVPGDPDADPIASAVAELGLSEVGIEGGEGAALLETGAVEVERAMSALAVEAAAPRHLFVTSPPGIGKTTIVKKLLAKLIAEEGEGGIEIQGFITEEVRDSAKQRSGFDLVSVGYVPSGRDPPRSPLARIGVAPPKVGKYTVDVQAFEDFALPLLKPPAPYRLPDNPRLYTPEGGVEFAVALVEELPMDVSSGVVEDTDVVQRCIITLPSTGEELTVDASTLSPVPEGWKPACEAEKERPRLFICDEAGKMELMSLKFGPAILESLGAGASKSGPSSCVLGTLPQPAKGQRDHELVDTIRHRRDLRVVRMTRNNRDELVDKMYAMLREGLGLGPPGTGVHVAGQKRLTEEEVADQEKEILRQHEEAKAQKKIADAEEERRKAATEEESKREEKKKKKKEKKDKHMLTPAEAQARIDARKRKRQQALQEGGPVALDSDDEGEAGKVASAAVTAPVVAAIEIADTAKKRVVGEKDTATAVPGISPANGNCNFSSEVVPATPVAKIVDSTKKRATAVAEIVDSPQKPAIAVAEIAETTTNPPTVAAEIVDTAKKPAIAAVEVADTAKKRGLEGLEVVATPAVVPSNGKVAPVPACADPAVATLEIVDSAEAAAARRARRDAKRRAAAAAQAAESVVELE